MKPIKSPISSLGKKKIVKTAVSRRVTICLFFLLVASACNPAGTPFKLVQVQPTSAQATPASVEVLITPTVVPTEPAATSEPDPVRPYYLPLAVKPDVAPQTIDDVIVEIDWAFVDESRVALHYTISGLPWPDGSSLDFMQHVGISSVVLADAQFGGFNGGLAESSSPAEHGMITANTDQLLVDGALDAEKHAEINLNVDIPVVGPTNVGTFHFNFNAPVGGGIKIENIDQMVVANNVSMTLKSLSLTASRAQALICFQMPSAVDWGLTDSRFTVGGREYPFAGGGLATGKESPSSAMTSPERCNDVGFDVAYDSQSDTSITITVPKLKASVNEVVTKETVAMANERLADKGIEFDYVNVDHGGNFVILKRPEGLSDEEIGTLIWDALAEQYEGPWVFTVEIPR